MCRLEVTWDRARQPRGVEDSGRHTTPLEPQRRGWANRALREWAGGRRLDGRGWVTRDGATDTGWHGGHRLARGGKGRSREAVGTYSPLVSGTYSAPARYTPRPGWFISCRRPSIRADIGGRTRCSASFREDSRTRPSPWGRRAAGRLTDGSGAWRLEDQGGGDAKRNPAGDHEVCLHSGGTSAAHPSTIGKWSVLE